MGEPGKHTVSTQHLSASSNGHHAAPNAVPDVPEWAARLVPGGAFALDAPATIPAVWGSGDTVAWASGEPLMLTGPQGTGKTSLAQQLALARAGLAKDGEVLGMTVAPGQGRVLYLACDRPDQARRSLARMVRPKWRATLNQRLAVWRGLLPVGDLGRHPAGLLEMARVAGADTVIIDSLKDVALRLSDDETGANVSQAMQRCVAEGIEVLALHHGRKQAQGAERPRSLYDVYGSGWLTAGCGSVVLLWGTAGDLIVEWSHLKPPADQVGPFKILHDRQAGTSAVQDTGADLLALAAGSVVGTTAEDAATVIFGTAKPNPNQVEKARYRLDKLAGQGRLARAPGGRGTAGQQLPTYYTAVS